MIGMAGGLATAALTGCGSALADAASHAQGGTASASVAKHDTASYKARPSAPKAIRTPVTQQRVADRAQRRTGAAVATPAAPTPQPATGGAATVGQAPSTGVSARPTSVTVAARPTVVNVLGTLAFRVFEAFENAIVGPARVPPNSNVEVSSAPLAIDCGPGVTVKADWYFPTTGPAPTRLIYFQHGWPGTSAMYDYTAAALAERTHSIVVAPTISGNLFDCYGCQVGGEQMSFAVAHLFLGDRAALTESARLASGDTELELPDRFVLAGHSAGSLLAVDSGGFFDQLASPDERDNLVGVLLFDTDSVGGALSRGLGNLPDTIPVYSISAAPNVLNSYRGGSYVLAEARPGKFVGVELVGGTHADSLQSSNPLVQFAGQLAGGGLASPQNARAAQDLAVGWINDWFAGTHDGVYGDLGSTIDVPTTAGMARAYVLPVPAMSLDLFQSLSLKLIESLVVLKALAVCATPIDIPGAAQATSTCSV
jgi:hypothetical protein